jgi:hypothetical protein
MDELKQKAEQRVDNYYETKSIADDFIGKYLNILRESPDHFFIEEIDSGKSDSHFGREWRYNFIEKKFAARFAPLNGLNRTIGCVIFGVFDDDGDEKFGEIIKVYFDSSGNFGLHRDGPLHNNVNDAEDLNTLCFTVLNSILDRTI